MWDEKWSHVFRFRQTSNDAQREIFDNITKKMSLEAKQHLNEDISLEELMDALDKTSLLKSPGTDGLPSEFYIYYSKEKVDSNNTIMKFFHKVICEAYDSRVLPRSMRQIQIRFLFGV